jgi:hypothetical protein
VGSRRLVRAGLLPAIAVEPGWLTLPAILPGSQPTAALIRALAATARHLRVDWSVADIRLRLDDGGLTELADDLLLAGPAPRRTQLLITVDQFEEVLTQSGRCERARFAQLLHQTSNGSRCTAGALRRTTFRATNRATMEIKNGWGT